MSMENINGKLYAEESYPLADIGGGVVSKGQTIRHYEKMHPEHMVVSISSFKVDHETESVKIKVLVKPKTAKLSMTGKDGSEVIGERADNVGCGDRKPVALLNPGYDELLEKYNVLKAAVADDSQDFNLATKLAETKKMYSELQNERDEIGAKYDVATNELEAVYNALPDEISGNTPLSKLVAELKARYDALVIAVGKDAQKFSDLLVENEALKKQNAALAECAGIDISPEASDVQIVVKGEGDEVVE